MSALVAAIPLIVIGVCLAGLKMKAHKAGPLAAASAIAIAVLASGMPAELAASFFSSGRSIRPFPGLLHCRHHYLPL